ncbi:MAG: hypothetical protein HY064_00580 [Bacteroidetes bacterium]|nr:hypothetical protein [Bacteroidota bacterium]
MVRSLIIIVNLFIALFVKLITGTDPTADVKAPSDVKAGEPFTVEVTIQTNGETGFLRYAMNLPEGWTAEKVETDGSSFMFEKQIVKFLWSRVGDTPELKISYKVTPPATASGTFELSSKISHTVDNLPSNIQLTPLKVNVTGESGTQVVDSHTDSTAKPAADVHADRTVPADEVSGSFEVSISIGKDDLSSFGKFEDSLPAGFSAQVIDADGSDFKFENNKAKFSWWALPQKNSLNIKYKVIVSPDVSGPQTITGFFSYVENGTGKVVQTSASIVKVKETQVVVDNQQQQQQQQQAKTGAGVKYSVQIAAMSRRVPISYYKSTYSISENINMEQHNGLNKYTVGSFTVYGDARNHREEVKAKGVVGPFVTAYNSGTRITVQEALMITSQKWVQ